MVLFGLVLWFNYVLLLSKLFKIRLWCCKIEQKNNRLRTIFVLDWLVSSRLIVSAWLSPSSIPACWKLMIDQKFRVIFQISQPANIPQKWFNTQNGPLDVRFQRRLNPTMGAFYFWKNQTETMIAPWFLPDFSINQKPPWLDIQRSVLSTEPFLRNIWGLRYLTNNFELLINH